MENTAGHKQSWRLLKWVNDNLLTQVTEKPTRRDAMLDFVLTNGEKLVGNAMLQGSLGCRDHKMAKFEFLRAVRRAYNKLTAPDFRRTDFGLFKDLLSKVSWDRPLEGRQVQKCCLNFRDHLLQTQEQCILARRKLGKNARRPSRMDKELLRKFRAKKRSFQEMETRTGGLVEIQGNYTGS